MDTNVIVNERNSEKIRDGRNTFIQSCRGTQKYGSLTYRNNAEEPGITDTSKIIETIKIIC
jgi:hypothetical protein